MVVCGAAVLGKDNNPLFIRAFGAHNQLRFHFIVHTALDFVEEKVAAQRQAVTQQQASGAAMAARTEPYLGLLYPTEELRVYGYLSNCRVKLIVVLDDDDVDEQKMRALFRRLHTLYVDTVSNPFHPPDAELHSCASFSRQIERIAEMGLY